jgi:hypothetical protein
MCMEHCEMQIAELRVKLENMAANRADSSSVDKPQYEYLEEETGVLEELAPLLVQYCESTSRVDVAGLVADPRSSSTRSNSGSP